MRVGVTKQCWGGDGVRIEEWAEMTDAHEVRFPGHGDGLDLRRGRKGECGK